MDYSFPLPLSALKTRFGPVFSRFSAHQNATLLALPYTGRTSLLRFISTNPSTQKDLGINPNTQKIIWLELDRTDYSYSQFLKELSVSLAPEVVPSDDDYLTSLFISQKISALTRTHHLIIIVTLNWKTIPALPDIDRLLTMLLKSSTPQHLNYLFSIDTAVYRSLTSLHPSSAILEKIYDFPTFTKDETTHNLKRLFLSKNISPTSRLLTQSFALTGGIAGFFHSFTNLGPGFISHPSLSEILTLLKTETAFFPHLASSQAKNVIMAAKTQISLGDIKLNRQPTAQEINLLKLFTQHLNAPITRDQIATTLWGKNPQKYSDWAIDKTLSRLRKLISSPGYYLVTIKNLGYQLTTL